MGVARQHGDGRNPHPDISLGLCRPEDRRWQARPKRDRSGDAGCARTQIGILDEAVAKTGYLAGDQFTLADINLLPILYWVRQLPEGTEAFATAPHLAAYYERHATRPSFKETLPPLGPPRRAKPS
jgi:glutathione S-transferase